MNVTKLVVTAATGSASTTASTRRGRAGTATLLHDAVAAGDHAANRRAGFRMRGQRLILHALLDLKLLEGLVHGFVDVNRHSF